MKLGKLFKVLGGLSHSQVRIYEADMSDESGAWFSRDWPDGKLPPELENRVVKSVWSVNNFDNDRLTMGYGDFVIHIYPTKK